MVFSAPNIFRIQWKLTYNLSQCVRFNIFHGTDRKIILCLKTVPPSSNLKVKNMIFLFI